MLKKSEKKNPNYFNIVQLSQCHFNSIYFFNEKKSKNLPRAFDLGKPSFQNKYLTLKYINTF